MRLNIAAKIALGFGLVTIAVFLNGIFMSNALQKSQNVNETITNVYTPSLELINKMQSQISDSRMLIKSWVHIDKISDTPDKLKLKQLHSTDYPRLIDTLMSLSSMWDSKEQQELLKKIHTSIVDTLFPRHQYIMSQLNTFESYDDPFVVFEVTPMTEEGGEVMTLTENILNEIGELQAEQEDLVNKGRIEMVKQFARFRKFIFIMSIGLILASIIIGIITIRSLANPINKTKNILLQMSKGILPKGKLKEGNDEVGQMSKALNLLVQTLKDISNFTVAIGKGNFDDEFKPLSDQDTLGQSLIEMREELKKAKQEEEKRQEEVQQRNWSSQGVALFSDILRKYNDNIE
ncbi:MAG: methyl-accepting chemotaxis protein, partial [Bacteroidales bacterium]